MALLLRFQKVSLYKDQPFGVSEINLELERSQRYLVYVKNEDQLNTLVGLIEGRYRKESGYIERQQGLFIQSDRLLLGDKVYQGTVGDWLAIHDQFFRFGNRLRSKFGFVQSIKAKHLLDYPIYKLQDNDRVKFTLLSLAFQERGIILISKLPMLELSDFQRQFLIRILHESQTTCCWLSARTNGSPELVDTVPGIITKDFSQPAESPTPPSQDFP